MTARPTPAPTGAPIGFAEFTAMVAALMALGALGIDTMLPALPAIGEALGVAEENRRQFVITAFLLGFGVGQLLHGPLADRYGRRPVLVTALVAYAAANLVCAVADSFPALLAARVLGGMAGAATRVVPIAIVRDRFEGRAMARVMSTAFIMFMIVPVLAPTVGVGLLLVSDWRFIFAVIAGLAAVVAAWFWIRMPETQHPEDRLPLSPARIAGGWRTTVTDRLSLGYMLAAGAMQGGIYGYLNSIGQVVGDSFGRPTLLPLVFALTAGAIALSNFANARFVMRFGQRLLSHGSVCAVLVIAALHLAVYHAGLETLTVFIVLQAMTLACFGMIGTNFSTMAMQNMGHIAGTASSVQGFASVMLGSLIGAVIGQAFDGTPAPMIAGFIGVSMLALLLAAVTERGRLFHPVPPGG
ncbi:multidrug effflux MFS transporter [uncultured Sphingomonas sp.]|uniref:multidrug effflux MFS transporter n=1 Tax=uncultured Sphingomonas sp. TaxID=158754 RepID=UPI0035C9E4BD